jgi:hypothetical protein
MALIESASFLDVTADSDAERWARQTGISTGTGGDFLL